MIRLASLVLAVLVCLSPFAQAQTPKVIAELSAEETVVGQPLVLRLTILVPTWMPKPAVFPNFEVPSLMVRLPEKATVPTSQSVDGETWSGVIRSYRLYPLAEGPFELPAGRVTVHYAKPGSIDPLVYEAPVSGVTFTATVPGAARTLSPLILAQGFTLSQEIEGETSLSVGDAITRTITAGIDGTTPVMIPQLAADTASGVLRVYPSDPVVDETEERGRLSGSRTETVSYVAQAAGEVSLPAITLDWFNLDSGQVETATVPGLDLQIAGASGSSARPTDPRVLAKRVGIALAILVAVLVVYRFAAPRVRAAVATLRATWQASEPYAHRRVARAIRSRDLNGTMTALTDWIVFYPHAGRPSAYALRTALAELAETRFGTSEKGHRSGDWSAVARSYRETRKTLKKNEKAQKSASALPPLNPGLNG